MVIENPNDENLGEIVMEIAPGIDALYVLDKCLPNDFKNKQVNLKGATLVYGTELKKIRGYNIPEGIEKYLESIAYLRMPKIKLLRRRDIQELSSFFNYRVIQKKNIVAEWNFKDNKFEVIKDDNRLLSTIMGEGDNIVFGAVGPNVKYHGYSLLNKIVMKYIDSLSTDQKRDNFLNL